MSWRQPGQSPAATAASKFARTVRLKDIAAQAGVSVMTVSKALRGEPDVSPTTRTRIKLLAQQMGYVPDSSAQELRTRATRLFGLVVSSLTHPGTSQLVLAIADRAHEMNYDVLLAQSGDSPEREESCIGRFLSRRVEGLLVAPVYRIATEARIYQELLGRRLPTVVLGHSAPFCSHFVNVDTDDFQASHAATEHLLKLGHKRIAFLSGGIVSPSGRERFEGYRRALRDAGLEVDDKLVFQAGNAIDDGAKAALQMINESCDATAVQAVNDFAAVGCAETLMKQGIRIPQDISVVGFGGLPLSEHFRVPLTTIKQPTLQLGMAAMDAMVALLRGSRPEPKRLATELIVRASTGIAPATHKLRQLKSAPTTV